MQDCSFACDLCIQDEFGIVFCSILAEENVFILAFKNLTFLRTAGDLIRSCDIVMNKIVEEI